MRAMLSRHVGRRARARPHACIVNPPLLVCAPPRPPQAAVLAAVIHPSMLGTVLLADLLPFPVPHRVLARTHGAWPGAETQP